MRSRVLKGALAVVAIVAMAGLIPVAASAATFNYSQVGGFYYNPADPAGGPSNPTGTGGSLGGFELSGPVAGSPGLPPNSAPANTYRDLTWGCGFPGATNCPATGTNVVSPSTFGNADRSGLRIDTVRGSLDLPHLVAPAGIGGTSWTGPLTGVTANFAADPTSGLITSDGTWVFLSHLFHDNNAIDQQSITLATASILTNLRISATPQFSDLDSLVNITFDETFNGEPCANPVGDPCADRFTFTINTFGELTFTDGDLTYLLQFDLFTNDPNIVIEGNTVWTGEGDINDLWVIMRLTQVVPLPGSLLLLGAGLLGTAVVGVVRRRRAVRN